MCPTTHPYYDAGTNLCYDTCVGQITDDLLCCPDDCEMCSSMIVCTTCSLGFYLRSDQLCYSTCLVGTFSDINSRICELCPTDCAICSSSNACLMCLPSYYLRNDSLCYSSCLVGYYPQTSDRTCVGCPLNCASCNQTTSC